MKKCEHCGKVASDVSIDRYDNLLCDPCAQAVDRDAHDEPEYEDDD